MYFNRVPTSSELKKKKKDVLFKIIFKHWHVINLCGLILYGIPPEGEKDNST